MKIFNDMFYYDPQPPKGAKTYSPLKIREIKDTASKSPLWGWESYYK